MASKFSRPKPSGSIRAWHEAQFGSARCCSIRCPERPDRGILLVVGERRRRSGGGGGGGVPRISSRIHLPRLTGEVRVGFEVTVRDVASVTTPPRCLPARATRRNWSPVTPLIP